MQRGDEREQRNDERKELECRDRAAGISMMSSAARRGMNVTSVRMWPFQIIHAVHRTPIQTM